MRTSAEIRCPNCNWKFEPIFTHGWGHKAIYDEHCRCGQDFRVEKIVYSDDYFGVMYTDRYIIHNKEDVSTRKVKIVGTPSHLIFNDKHYGYEETLKNEKLYIMT